MIAGKRPDSVLGIIVFHRQLSFPLTAAFIHETAGKGARACISERGKPGRLLSLRGKITNSSTCSGTFLIDDTPRQVMTIQIEQTAFIAECERISRHGIGLELSILHQHQNGHATLQPNGGSSITIRAIQARFADVTQRATRDIAVFIIGHVILSRTAAHAKNSLIITGTGNGHDTLPHLAPFFCGSSGQLQREFCTLVDDKAGTVERGRSILFGEFPLTGVKGHGTGSHIYGSLKLQRLHIFRIRCAECQTESILVCVR